MAKPPFPPKDEKKPGDKPNPFAKGKKPFPPKK